MYNEIVSRIQNFHRRDSRKAISFLYFMLQYCER
nr:MAG TPA: hypothetical protein [Caudoviricetes sp.]DAS96057.1 MAG TPA: hypothetical protein [Caudoviricetes sp.]